jgi:thioredoxin-related protein
MVEEELDIDEAVASIDEVVAAIDEAVAAADETATTTDEVVAAEDDPNSGTAVTSKDKRKRFGVWDHFHEVKVKNKKGQMVMMNKCIHYDRMYKVVMGGPTSTLQRYLQTCPYFKRSKGKTQNLIRFESCESDTVT